MNSFYNLSGGFKHFTSTVIIVLSIMILLTVGAFLLKILFYLAPIALIAWIGYKFYVRVKLYFSKKTKDNHANISTAQGASSEEIIKKAIEEQKVIDVEYKEM